MNSIFARCACLVLGLAASTVQSGCASNRKEGPELNPRVTGQPSFVGTGGERRVEMELEVEQREPYVMHDHTWSVYVWTSSASSDALSPDQVDAMMSEPPFAALPDLNARKSEAELNTLEYDAHKWGGYYVVVVAAVEKTKGPYPKVTRSRRTRRPSRRAATTRGRWRSPSSRR